jgi:hypothetical protein
VRKYPLNKCGSCEGCWYKSQESVPVNILVQEGKCPAYRAFEFKPGRTITIKHWTDDVLYAGTITEIDDQILTLECEEITLFIGLSSIYEHMNNAYDEILK